MVSKSFKVKIVREGPICYIPVSFDPKSVFGKVRAPVRVTLNGYTYRSTIAAMGTICIPLRQSHREAARLHGTERLRVRLELDVAPRIVAPPEDLVKALEREGGAWVAWKALSYSHQREHVEAIESAKAEATRARRIAAAVRSVVGTLAQGVSEPPALPARARHTRAARSPAGRGGRRTRS